MGAPIFHVPEISFPTGEAKEPGDLLDQAWGPLPQFTSALWVPTYDCGRWWIVTEHGVFPSKVQRHSSSLVRCSGLLTSASVGEAYLPWPRGAG